MATAEELLSGSTSRDRTCVIDSDLRTIVIPRTVTNLGVESDDDVMRLPFRMPAEYCGVDLTKFAIRINYLNANAEPDVYEVTNMTDNGDGTISFFWLVGRHAALYKGDVKFNVCMRLVEGTGTGAKVKQEFNTTIATLPILEGLETAEDAILSIPEYNDIFEQWRSDIYGAQGNLASIINQLTEDNVGRINEAGDKNVQTMNDYMAGVRDAAFGKADAIVQTANGETVRFDGASYDHLRGLRVLGNTRQVTTTGKNLLDVPPLVHWSGTYSKSISIPPGTYTLSFKSATWHSTAPVCVRFSSNDQWYQLTTTPTKGITLTFDREETQLYMYSNGSSATNSEGVEATVEQLMISVSGGDYEPYSNGAVSPNPVNTQPLISPRHSYAAVYGKNLINMAASGYYEDGVLKVPYSSGNVMGSVLGTICVAPGEKYTFSYEYEGGDRIIVQFVDEDDNYFGNVDLGWGTYLPAYNGVYGPVGESGVTITVPDRPNIHRMHIVLCCMMDCGAGNNNIYSNVQLERGPIATDYEPYITPKGVKCNVLVDQDRPGFVGVYDYSARLFGVPVTEGGNYVDTSGQQWLSDEVDFARGVFIQRFGRKVFNGSENWAHYANAGAGVNQLYTMVDDCYTDSEQINAMSPQLRGIRLADRSFSMNTVYTATQSGWDYICMNMPDFNDTASFKEFLKNTPIEVIYRLKDPIEHPMSADNIETFTKSLYSHPTSTVVDNGYPKPFLEVSYNVDTKTYIDKLRATITELSNEVEDLKKNGMPGVARISDVYLPASGWVGTTSPYRQVVTVPGATENSQVDLTPSVEQLTVFHNKDLAFVAENEDGVVTVYAIGQKPTNDYTIQVTITEVVR